MHDSPKKRWLDWYFRSSLLVRILIGLVAGAAVGLAIGPRVEVLQPLGTIFVRLLQMIVVPLIVSTLVVGAAGISPARLGRVGLKTVGFFLLTTACAVVIGLAMGNAFRPGAGMALAADGQYAADVTPPSLLSTFIEIVPTNPFESVTEGRMLPIIFFSILFGIGLSYLQVSDDDRIRSSASVLFQVFTATAEVMYLIVGWVLQYAPIGVFALIAVVFGTQGATAFGPLATVTIAVYLGLAVQLLLVYGGLLAINRLSLLQFLAGAREAMITAFVSRSSGGTLPVSMRNAEENLGISRAVHGFALPLGATINMNGTAIYQGVCVLFIGFAINMPLPFTSQVTIIVTAVLASIGTAGVPGSGTIMLLIVLDSVGLPVLEGTPVALAYAMVLGIDALLDMGRTSLNVTGDLLAATLVAKSEGELDPSKW